MVNKFEGVYKEPLRPTNTELALKNLWPGRDESGKATDPELIAAEKKERGRHGGHQKKASDEVGVVEFNRASADKGLNVERGSLVGSFRAILTKLLHRKVTTTNVREEGGEVAI